MILERGVDNDFRLPVCRYHPLRISIITVTRNADAYLEKCIQSVADQKYPNLEYLIIDGASTDKTSIIAKRFERSVTTFISEPDNGLYDAMNKGIRRASGDYILFLGADDYLYDRNVIGDAVQFLTNRANDFVYGNIAVRGRDGRETIFRPPPPDEALKFMVCGCLPHQASLPGAIFSTGSGYSTPATGFPRIMIGF